MYCFYTGRECHTLFFNLCEAKFLKKQTMLLNIKLTLLTCINQKGRKVSTC